MSDYGYVYCLINEAMSNYCKIGMVHIPKKTSHMRARELSTSTGCPMPFVVVYDIMVKNPLKYEKILHNKLDMFRYNKNREFFKCNPYDIINYFKMENLIQNIEDKNDFHKDYFKLYLDNIYFVIDYNKKNNKDDDKIDNNKDDDKIDNNKDDDKIDNNKDDDKIDNNKDDDKIDNNKDDKQCNKCKKEFKYKYLLIRHEKNKKSCDLPKKYVKKNIINKENDIKIKKINIKIDNFDSDIEEYNYDLANYDIDIKDIDTKIEKINNKISELYKKSIKKKILCTYCNTIFLNKTNLLRHIKNSCIKNKELYTKINDFTTQKNKIIDDKNKIIENINKINNEKKLLEAEKNSLILDHRLKNNDDEIKKLRVTIEKIMKKIQ